MDSQTDKSYSILKSLDWWTIGIYLALLLLGWLSVCGASYNYGDVDIFSLSTRSGMQIVWIGTSILLGFILLMLDDGIYDTLAYIIYAVAMGLLLITVFFHHEIRGSNSWLALGPIRLQPAEFAKFATALALAKLMNVYGFSLNKRKDLLAALAVIFIPILLILAQKETGCALVFLSFLLVLYREGMTGGVLFTGLTMIIYFVVGLSYKDALLLDTLTRVGGFFVMMLINIFSSWLVFVYRHDRHEAFLILTYTLGITLLTLLFAEFVIHFNMIWVQLLITLGLAGYLLYRYLHTRIKYYLFIMAFTLGSVCFSFATEPFVEKVLKEHQRTRVYVLLGVENDIMKEGYNVNQSKIAIGSGGLKGKGFLNGTQTKLKFVPEQDTDFIFCTVGEEEGFIGSAAVLLLFLALILRLIIMAERQTIRFGRVYGYGVISIFMFHLCINVGMVLGLTPVIGIPLPFFSYGGSSLWGFTILLFIFLKIDASRNKTRA
ncbi:MAG: rod shape-determining protein RodA [Prevotella sp.]|nr:rod shape-determining protein RodA [Prevotella sp.]